MQVLRIRTTNGGETSINMSKIEAFKFSLRGDVLSPNDKGYEDARKVWNGMIDKKPAIIARCKGTADVISAVNFARDNHLHFSVRGGGHNVAGTAVCNEGLVIDLSPMRSVRVDSKSRTAHVEGGATWGGVYRETQAFGLAISGGVVSTTGVAGLTLGGGYGWLRRKYGLTCDDLLSVDIVTAEGELRRASNTENTDLFWGLRGGGGNFGVVTSFEFRLHPIESQLLYVVAVYAAEKATRVFRAWRDYVITTPCEVTSDASLWVVPSIPELPAEIHGRKVVLVEAVYGGTVEAGKQVLQPLRELDEVVLDLSRPVKYTVLNSELDAFVPPGVLQYYWKSLYLHDLSDEAIETIVGWGAQCPSSRTLMPIRHLGGAISRVGSKETAFVERSAQFLLSIDSIWENPRNSEENIAWTRNLWQDMHRFSSGGAYLNFPGLVEEGDDLLKRAYGSNYERLQSIKAKYDPNNLFQGSLNIRPA